MSTSRRDSDSKRHSSSKYDRHPSPKRSRRDDSEKGLVNVDGDSQRDRDYDQRRLPLDVPSRKDEDAVLSKGAYKISDQLDDSDKRKVSEKREMKATLKRNTLQILQRFQEAVSIFSMMTVVIHGDPTAAPIRDPPLTWGKDSRDLHGDREASRYKSHTRDGKATERGNKDRSWCHDGFFELEANPPQPALRKRPAFSEQKIAAEDVKKELPNKSERGERDSRISRHLERDRGARRPYNRDKGEHQGFGSSSGDRFDGSTGNNRERDGTNGRQGHQATARSDKWKHDMFSLTNRSPTPKNEEDQIAKVEALLAS